MATWAFRPVVATAKASSSAALYDGDEEERYWSRLKSPFVVECSASVASVQFRPARPESVYACAATQVNVIGAEDGEIVAKIAKSKEPVTALAFRDDGKLAGLGNEAGEVLIVDCSSRTVLRRFAQHTDAVRSIRFLPDRIHVVSVGDDATVRVWDVPAERQAACLPPLHTDHVRALDLVGGGSMVVTGSYDHSVRLWDTATQQCLLHMDHGAPVEAVLALPGGSVLVSAGLNVLKFWDVRSEGRLIHSLVVHQKTITALDFIGSSASLRLVTGSLDRHVKLIDVATFKTVGSLRFPAAVMSLSASRTSERLAVGLSNGQTILRMRRRPRKTLPGAVTARGREKVPEQCLLVPWRSSKKLRPYDQLLKKGQYRDALDAVVATRDTAMIGAVLGELSRQGVLRVAVSGRDELSLLPLLEVVRKNVVRPAYCKGALEMLEHVVDLYGRLVGVSAPVDEALLKIQNRMAEEMLVQERLLQLDGMAEAVA